MDDRAELIDILREKSLLRGNFVLASGRVSDYYLDCKRTTLSSPRGLELTSRLMFEKIRELRARGVAVDAIGGLTIGAAPLSITTAQQALRHGWNLPVFVVRDEQKSHGTQRLIEGGIKRGWNVVIVDDVMTTGKSVMKAIQAVESEGSHVVSVLILVDRDEGGADALRAYNVESLISVNELMGHDVGASRTT